MKLSRLHRVVDATELEASRRETLHVLLLGTMAGAAVTGIIVLLAYLLGHETLGADALALLWSAPALIGGCLVLLLINHYLSGVLASSVFVVLLIVAAVLSDTPQQVADGRAMLTFALPILAASLLVRPWAGFVAAGLSSCVVVLVRMRLGGGLPNIPGMLVFAALATIAWLATRGLESVSVRLRASNAALAQRTEELALLDDASRTLSQSLDLDTLYQHIREIIRTRMSCDALYVSSYDPADGLIRCVAGWQDSQRMAPDSFPQIPLEPEGHGTQSVVIRSGSPLLVPDLDARQGQTQTTYWMDDDGKAHEQIPVDVTHTRSALLVPLTFGGQVRGVVQVLSYQLEAYGEADLRFLQALAPHMMAATNNARLYRQAREDLAERERAQQALRESEERYRTLFEGVPIGLYRTRPDGAILTANQALASMLGYDDAETLRIHAQEAFVDPADRERELALLQQQGKVHGVELRLRRNDGRVIWARDTVRAVCDERGTVRCFEGSLEDVTEHKQLEEQLQQARRLETVGQLAGGIAHEFNNLLQVVNGYTDLALDDEAIAPALRADLLRVRRAGARAAELTAQLLAFGRRQFLRMASLPLNPLLTDLRRALEPLIGQDMALVMDLAPDLGVVVADGGQIAQVVLNLAANARDAIREVAPTGGTITIATCNTVLSESREVHQGTLDPGRYVCLSVADTGAGMSAEVQKRLFEPFFTTKGVGRGTGLGLAAVYGIIKQLGGSIQVRSEPGRGTTFTLYLPRSDQATDHS